MPRVKMPTGETVDMPDNPTPEQLSALANLHGTEPTTNSAVQLGGPPAQPAAAQPPARTTTETVLRKLGLAVRPAAEAAGSTAGMVGDALNTAINMGGAAIGHNPQLGMPSAAISRGIDAVLPKPETTTERVVNGLSSMGYGAMGADPLANAIAKRLPSAASRTPTVREQTILDSQKAGYVVTPDQVPDTHLKGKITEFLAGKKQLKELALTKNQATTDALARADLHMPVDAPLTKGAMQQGIEANYDAGYEPIKQAGQITNGGVYRRALDKIKAEFGGASASFPGAADQNVEQLVASHRVPQFDAKDAVEQIKNLRMDANASFSRHDPRLGLSQKAISDALENSIELNLNSRGAPGTAMLNDFQNARTNIAKLGNVQRAIREGTGDVDAMRLGAVFQKNPNLLTGGLQDIGRFANTMPSLAGMPKEQTPVQNILRMLGGSLPSAAMGALFGAPGVAAGTAVPIARSAVRHAMLSPAGQRMIAPAGFDPGLIEKLLGNKQLQQAFPSMLTQLGLYRPQTPDPQQEQR